MTVHITRWGLAGPTVVCIHGSAQGSRVGGDGHFATQRALADHGWQLLVPDRPGHGQSPANGQPDDADLDGAWVADDLLANLPGGAHLVGHSFGGAVALAAAARRPGAVRSLTLIEPGMQKLASRDPAVRRFGMQPKVALLSASNFGTMDLASARKMQAVLKILEARAPDLEVEGEMHGDAALSEEIRLRAFPRSRLKGEANLLIMPTLDAANIAFNLLKTTSGDGVTIGPILLGAARAVHIVTPSATVRRLVNMTAVTVVDAGDLHRADQRLI